MLGNWVTLSDFRRLREKIGQSQIGASLRKLGFGRRERIGRTWEDNREAPPINFWNIPEVQRQWNRSVSGDPAVDHRQYIAGKYLAGRGGLLALSLGCGSGGNERAWADLGLFARIDAFDLSPVLIDDARERAAAEGREGVLNYFAADALTLEAAEGHYDLVLAEGALHHLSPLTRVLNRVRRWLKPGGLFLVNDFVGPSRFNWTRTQVREAEALLRTLPERLRATWSGGLKKTVDRPGRLRMWLADPSEAVQSARIRPLLGRFFELLEVDEKGGALLNLVLYGIAHHFRGADPEADLFLQRFIAVENALMASGRISSDFILAVCRKRP